MKGIFAYLLLFIAIIGVGYLGVHGLVRTARLQTGGERIVGVVEERYSAHRTRSGSATAGYVVRYDKNGDGAEEREKIPLGVFSLFATAGVGEQVTVLTDPSGKEQSMIDQGWMTWAGAYLDGAFFTLVACALLMFSGFLLKTGKLTR